MISPTKCNSITQTTSTFFTFQMYACVSNIFVRHNHTNINDLFCFKVGLLLEGESEPKSLMCCIFVFCQILNKICNFFLSEILRIISAIFPKPDLWSAWRALSLTIDFPNWTVNLCSSSRITTWDQWNASLIRPYFTCQILGMSCLIRCAVFILYVELLKNFSLCWNFGIMF